MAPSHIKVIDQQLHLLWHHYRTTTDPAALQLLEQIDQLLEQRHTLTTTHGEPLDTRDIPTSSEWDGADTGQAA